VTVDAKTARGQSVAAELLLMPLRHAGPSFDRVLGSLAVLDRPYWLGNEAVERQTITSLRLIWPDSTPRFGRRRSDRADLEMPIEMPGPKVVAIPPANARRHKHLFVLDGGKT
jgi:hypothetical protein